MASEAEASQALRELGMLPAQQRKVPSLSLLAFLELSQTTSWNQAINPPRGTSELLNYANEVYGTTYKPNTRESFRKNAVHHFIEAALIVQNPGQMRDTNSQDTVYRMTEEALSLFRSWGTPDWEELVTRFKQAHGTPVERNAHVRERPVTALATDPDLKLRLSESDHSKLIFAIVEIFGGTFTPGGHLIYAGGTDNKWSSYFDQALLESLGVLLPDAGTKMPDVLILFSNETGAWLVVVEAYESGGEIDTLRKKQLATLLSGCTVPIVFVTAFKDRATHAKRSRHIAWETDVWVWEHEDHLIHYNGEHLLQRYPPVPEPQK